jgi:hypothetical protein
MTAKTGFEMRSISLLVHGRGRFVRCTRFLDYVTLVHVFVRQVAAAPIDRAKLGDEFDPTSVLRSIAGHGLHRFEDVAHF